MSRTGLRQWAAVNSTRELRTSAEQKPAVSPPRVSTIATRPANVASGVAPIRARAGASGAATAVMITIAFTTRVEREVMAGFMR